MELNAENILDALNNFEKKPSEIPPVLEDYLQRIAKNGEIVFPWCKLKPLLKKKLEIVLDEFYESCPVEISVQVPNFEAFNFDNLKKSILQAVDAFTSAPFTIQRLCELVTNPKKHYNRTDKYMRGIEKNVLVVSTIEHRSSILDGNNINASPVVNGMINDSPSEDNDCFNGHENSDNLPQNLNTPANHVLLENFANVFPSAACIPSASNICINRDMDSNFIAASECVEEVAFESTIQDQPESMDTKTDDDSSSIEQPTYPSTPQEMSSDSTTEGKDVQFPVTSDKAVNEAEEAQASTSEDSTVVCDSTKDEAECTESEMDSATEVKQPEDDLNPQDNAVSQSDENASEADKASQSDTDTINDTQTAEKESDSTTDTVAEVSQSTPSEALDSSMGIEASNVSEDVCT